MGSLTLAGARVGRASRSGRPLRARNLLQLAAGALARRPRPLAFVGQACQCIRRFFLAQSGLGMLLASAAHLPNCSLKRTAADGLR